MKTEIRLWTENDIKQIAELEKQAITVAWSEKMLKEEWSNPLFKIAVCQTDGAFAAHISFHEISGEIDIDNIAVKEEYRRKGIATKLMNWLSEYALKKDIKGITLEVGENNEAAISMYKKLGYQTEGIRKNYYSTEAALIMWKYL